jgi:hypothetical protein
MCSKCLTFAAPVKRQLRFAVDGLQKKKKAVKYSLRPEHACVYVQIVEIQIPGGSAALAEQ